MMDIVHSRGRRNCGEYRLKVPESIAGKDCDFWNHMKGKNEEEIVEKFCFLFWKYQDWLHFGKIITGRLRINDVKIATMQF